MCPEKCEGTIVDISKHYFDPVNWEVLREILDDYQHYKYSESINISNYYNSIRNKPKLVVISLKTSMFHRITKVGMRLKQTLILSSTFQDRAAKLVDKLADIGGTMGLLTGFSFISFAEILYFTIKILLEIMKKKGIIKY